MVTQLCNVNLIPGDVPPIIHVKQYDTGLRTLIFTVYNGESVFSIPSDATVKCEGTKPDRKGFSYEVTFDGSEVTVDLEPQMTAVGGRATCQLTIGQDDGILGTANFILDIEHAALGDDTVLSASDLATVTQLVNTATDAAESAANDASAAAQSATNAESSAASAATSSSEAASAAANAVAGKADKVTPSTAGNVALLASDGNLQDSGKQFTPAGIGAAPDGYGIGADATDYPPGNDCDQCWEGGYYNIGSSTANGPLASQYGTLQVIPRAKNSYTTQIIYTHNRYCAMRVYNNGWQPWEWVNPPMAVGEEYRTIERWKGNVVYTKLLNCGAAAYDKSVNTGISASEIIRYYATCSGAAVPYLWVYETGGLSSTSFINIRASTTKIDINVGSDHVGAQVYCAVWYTK